MEKLRYLVKKRKKSVLNKIIDFFKKSSFNAYLVGGVVRDALLNTATNDIDITIEGDAIKAGYELNRILRGKIEVHKDFGTVTISKDKTRIDIAMARKETYPKPGSLPLVSPSDIYDDLKRRDFTINAIALAISKENFGEVFDPFNGINDIKKKLIRVLHDKSFIEDPTRILRALRYKNRLNFKLDKHTEKLLMIGSSCKVVKNVSKQRILQELRLIFEEKEWLNILKDINKYKLLEFDMERLKNLRKIPDLKYYYFLSLMKEDFPLSNQETKIINDFKKLDNIRRDIQSTKRNSQLYYLLINIDEKVVKTISALYPGLSYKIKKFYALKKIKPLISGEDLKKMNIQPGPVFKELLNGIHKMQLDRKIKNRKQIKEILQKWVNVS